MSKLLDLVRAKKTAMSAKRRAPTTKIPEGVSRWRILPSWRKDGDVQFFHDFGVHFIKDPATDELKATYVCVDKTYGRPCEICDAIGHAAKSCGDEELAAKFKDMNASGRILVNALRVEGENPNQPVLLEMPPTAFEAFLGVVEEWGDEVLDLANGRNIVIERTGKGIGTKYTVQVAAKTSPVSPAVMSQVTDIDEYVKQENEEHKNRALSNLNAVAGALPAPGSRRLGSAPVDELDVDETLFVPGEPLSAKPAGKSAVSDAIDADFKMVDETAIDADLDDILRGIE